MLVQWVLEALGTIQIDSTFYSGDKLYINNLIAYK
jgi:hypothetical protein